MIPVENKIPDVSNLVKKVDYDAETLHIKCKYFTTANYNKFTNEKLGLKIKQKELVSKSDIAGFISNTDLDNEVATWAIKAELKAEQDKIKKLQAFDSSYFRGKNHFEDHSTQNYLVFGPMYKYFKKIGDTDHVSAWKSKGFSKVLILLLHLTIYLLLH